MMQAPSLSPKVWGELLALVQEETADRGLLERLLELWCVTHGAAGAALYLTREAREDDLEAAGEGVDGSLDGGRVHGAPAGFRGLLDLEVASGEIRLPAVCDGSALPDGVGHVLFPGRILLFTPAAGGEEACRGPLTLLLASSLRNLRLRQELKEQQFQVNYRVVELESLYDVGLAVAATLDLERVSEEILLRAVSLLDARRGALYVLDGESYRLDRTFGGDAASRLEVGNLELAALLSGLPYLSSRASSSDRVDSPHPPRPPELPPSARIILPSPAPVEPPPELLPGARYLLAVPIEIESRPRGLLVVGDKESRRGVGPFPPSSRRTLSLFANQAAIALENARLHLQALEKERLEREMHLAAEIQRQILPRSTPMVPGFQLVGWNRPARQVGGDYYDIFVGGNGRIGLVVGDVSGKGMPAALMVSTLHSALHLLLDQAGFGPPLLERLNRHILESSASNKFITMLLAEVDPATGSLLFLNAGHNPGFLLRASGGPEEVVQLASSGLPLGLLAGSRFLARELVVEPGDLLCLYTDGITECESPGEEEFGNARLIELLREHRERPLGCMLEAIQCAMAEFSAGLPQGDDQTVVLLRRDPSS